ncbi:MAG: cellulase family glycosylhydrolase [Ruminococcus sp.]|nr:cellulase family glycosylhydrolase [Ruminococcus sp.]
MKITKRLLSGALSLAVAASACLSSGIVLANATAPEGDYNSVSVLTASGVELVSTTNTQTSYVQTNLTSDSEDMLDSDYLYIVYTVNDTVTDDTKTFNLQPFNTSWGGWDDNYVTIGASDYDSSTGQYTYYVATQKIIQSLSSGTFYGINISFASTTTEMTLVDYGYLTEDEVVDLGNEEDYQLEEQEFILNVTGTDLVEAGYDEEALQTLISSNSGTVKFYVHISEANAYSWLQARSGSVNNFNENAGVTVYDDCGSGASNKYLTGYACTKQTSSNYPIQMNSDGDPIGSAGTGNYVFPNNAITTSKITAVKNYSLTIAIKTTGTEAEALGFVFSDGTAFTVNADGSLTLGFTVPTCESTTFESSDSDEDGEVWEQSVEKRRSNLKLTLDYIATMDSSKYTEDSWAALQDALVVAQAEYDNSSATAASLKSARDTLENVKANLIFATEGDDGSNAMPFRELTGAETVAEMGMGINLGNTMDGHSSFTPAETAWQSTVTTKEYITALHDAGYNTLRVPVTWGNMIDDDDDYSINENWLNRVQEIVDYAIEQDMYVIINVHHDGAEQTGWLRVAADDIDAVMEKFEGVWRTIATRFKDYDEHLIFESMNEVTCGKTESTKNASEAVNYDTPIMVNLNQLFVNTVRSTGSNNTKRWLTAVAHYANNGSSSLFTMPNDTYNTDNRLMFAAHIYSDVDGVLSRLKTMYNKFSKLGIPMYLGEYGRTLSTDATSASGYNDPYRAYYNEVTNRACQVYGICPIVWDQGFGDEGELQTGLYSYWNRAELRPIFKSITDASARGTLLEPSDLNLSGDFSDITYDTVYGVEVTEMTSITPSATEVELTIGDETTLTASYAPSDSNDVIVWTTDNEDVVTVYNGLIRAKGIGITTVHAKSLSGSVDVEIEVTVNPTESDETAVITTDMETYEVVNSRGINIEASASNGDLLTYRTTNSEVATVNSQGRVYGIANGEAYIVITAESGATKTVKVVVKDALATDEIELAIKVYYNDDTHQYWSAETGDTITVTEDGTYTLTFDVDEDLSSAAIAAGITSISNLTAIYIQDQTVALGNATKSPLDACNITYNSVKVDGVELTLNSLAGPKSALKSSGVFDTNDPINAWDGSAVEEVSANSSHVANFTTVSNPKTIEITFTLSDMEFTKSADARENPATRLTASSDTEVYADVGTEVELKVRIAPRNPLTDSVTSFVSSDESIVLTDLTPMTPDENGYITATVLVVGTGEATVTAMTENGYTVVFTINPSGGDVTGTINVSDEDATTEMTVTAVAEDGTETSVTAISMGEYTIEGLASGTYTLVVSGGKYVPREYSIEVDTEDITQDVSLNPYGDVNGDGKATTADVGLANSHAKGVNLLEDYEFDCADVNIDGSVTTADVGKINSHAKGVALLW